MSAYMEIAFKYINRLVDITGYLLMMILSLALWWGIYSGVEITVTVEQRIAQARADNLVELTGARAASAAGEMTWSLEPDESRHNVWSMASR